MALTRITNNGLDPNDEFTFGGLNVTGIVSATSGFGVDTNTVIDSSKNISAGIVTGTNINAGIISATNINAGIISATGGVQVATGATISGISNTIIALTNSSERLRITSGGLVGIGTDSPDFKLHSNETGGSTIAGLFETNQTDSYISFQASGTTASSTVRIGAVADNFVAFVNGLERLRITQDGQFLIGTVVPSSFNGVGGQHNLIVAGAASTTNILNNSAAAITISNTDGTADNTAGLHFAREDTDTTPHYTGASIVSQFKETQVTGQYPKADLAFLTSTAANNAPSEKMRISANGAVTITTQERFRVRKLTAQSGTDNTSTWVEFSGTDGAVDEDTHSGWSDGNNWYTLQNDGHFMIHASVLITSNTANSLRDYQMAIAKWDGSANTILSAFTARASTSSDDDTHSMNATFIGNLNAGDSIRLRVFGNTDGGAYTISDDVNDGVGGAGLDLTGTNLATHFSVVKLG